MIGFLARSYAASFARDLFNRLAEPRAMNQDDEVSVAEGRLWRVRGKLPLRAHGLNGQVECGLEITIPSNWLEEPPIVRALAPFIRRETDWHAYSDGGLCYVLRQEWADRLKAALRENDMAYVLNYAATWCIASTDSLASRHLLGWRHDIKQWPPEWKDWKHGELGEKEYLSECSSRG